MYQEVFDFNGRPFNMAPFVKHFFNDGPVKQALDQVNASINRDAGPSVIVGQHGTGKSLLLALLAEQYQQRFKVLSLSCGPMTERRDLLQAILFELKQPYRDLSEGELRLSLIDFIKPTENCPNGVLLLVDDAQSLTPDLVDELRLITNFVRDGIPRVRLVLCGTDRLEEVLTEPKLEPFNQRISARCYLANLTREHTLAYVHEHIARVGGDAAMMFEKATTDAIHEATSGCPRFVNQLCEQCMIYAATHGSLVVEPNMVEPAWAHVQGLPTPDPISTESGQAQPTDENWTVIEFGSLDDDLDSTFDPEESQQFSQLELEPEAQIDQQNSDGFEELQVTAEVQQVENESNFIAEPIEAIAIEPDADDNDWDEFDDADPYVATQPEADAAQTTETQVDEWPSTDQTYSYQPIEPEVISADQASTESQSIPTEIHALNEDQDHTWVAAGITPDTSFDETISHTFDPAVVDSIVSEHSDPTETSPADLQPAEEAFASESLPDADQPAESVFEVPVAPVVNPFAETFDSEESVSSAFSQVVAEQNASSMQVPGQQLEHLSPLDQESNFSNKVDNDVTPFVAAFETTEQTVEECGEWESLATQDVSTSEGDFSAEPDDFETPIDSPEATEHSVTDLHAVFESLVEANALSVDHVHPSANELHESVDPFKSATAADIESELDLTPETDLNNEFYSATPEPEQEAFGEHATTPSLDAEHSVNELHASSSEATPEPEKYHEHKPYQPTVDIQQEADRILSAIKNAEQGSTSHVSHETVAEQAAPPTTHEEPVDQYDDELSDAQRILGEILEQKNLVSEHVRGTKSDDPIAQPEPEYPQSVPMSQSLSDATDQKDGDDDSDMIVISEVPSPTASEPSSVAATPESGQVSIGRAERMDYESLFEQLRDVGNQS